ncbi:MAG: D-2-hydroxyacid dehydrogenase [Muribaculaceae bacterium]|nr:D-2-hydroxyacid dehydrogenase [Muribaculaceae bacterium]
MKITVLDGYGLNPGDMSWDGLSSLGEIKVYDRTSPGELLAHAADAEILLTNKVVLNREAIMALPHLKYIGVVATGYNIVDIEAAREKGITVTNIPAYSTTSVAQMVFALILAITNRVEYYAAENRAGRWSKSVDFCYWDHPITELSGKTMGIVGLGHIGCEVSRIAQAFGMKAQAYTSKEADKLPQGVNKAESMEMLLSQSDILSLHCPLTDDTRNMIDAEALALMKPSAILINTGRGPLVDEQALADALNSGKLRAAGLDVLSSEPPAADNPLLSARNCYITPHLGWATVESRHRLMDIAVENVANFIAGQPSNVIN